MSKSETFVLKAVRTIDTDGLWVVARDADGNEVEITIEGLTYAVLADAMTQE